MDIKTLYKELKELLTICIREQREYDFVQKLKDSKFTEEDSKDYRRQYFSFAFNNSKIKASSSFKDTGYGDRYTKYSLSIELYENGERIDHHFDSYET